MDIGRSINPAIDRGQIIGGFMQGMGWVTTEALRYGPERQTLVRFADDLQNAQRYRRAADFRVAFLDNAGE